MSNTAYSRLREKADAHGYRLSRPYRRWETNDFSPAFRLFDVETNLPVWPGFGSLAEVEAWLDQPATS